MAASETLIGIAANADETVLRSSLQQAKAELEFVYSLETRIARETHGKARLTRLLGELTRFLGTSYTVLMVPARNIRIAVTHDDWKPVDRKMIDDRLVRDIFPTHNKTLRPVAINVADTPHGARGYNGRYQLLIHALRGADAEALGFIATMCKVDGAPLTKACERVMIHAGRIAKRLIDDSFDPLTGFMRRDDFSALLEAAVVEVQDDADDHCLVYFDLDKVQVANDTFDQRAGDEILFSFSKLLNEYAPSGSSLARIGGDKFAILMRHRTLTEALDFAELMRKQCLAMVYLRGDKSFPVSVSGGVVSLSHPGSRNQGPLVVARLACAKAKDHGGDRIECFSETDASIVRRVDNLELFSKLQTAIDEKAFTLVAQPIVPVANRNAAAHFEILLRMNGEGGDVIRPDQFFAAAEHYQMMPRIDRHVLQTFFDTIEALDDCLALHEASFAINLSGQSLSEPAFHEFVRKLVDESMLNPQQICFEITETAAIASHSMAVDFMQTLRSRGCRIALDDFGAGLSSFAYLRDMPVDLLKIDGSFVQDLDTNKVSESMVAAIAQVARVMGLKTVAEYVETEAVLAGLQRLGVDYGQGYLLGRPKSLDEQLRTLTQSALVDGCWVNFTDQVTVDVALGDV
ncbi:MAG: bifunctional diguanylate cyclase/phosphodiesterase [Pseudomonadota bacterium]